MYTWIKIDGSRKKVADTEKATLEEWLYLIFKNKSIVFPNNCFPNDEARDEYLLRVHSISEEDVKKLLRILIQNTNRLGADNDALRFSITKDKEEIFRLMESSEYWRRNFSMRNDVWEGLTWVIDLLPDKPKLAMNAVEAYIVANSIHMTDHQYIGAKDCVAILQAKYFERGHSPDILLETDPVKFEWLIEKLYKNLGYSTQLTPASYDEGIDIIATKEPAGHMEKILIQCKRSKNNVGISTVRELYGCVSSFKATKGVVVSSAEFTPSAIKFAKNNPRIELIGYNALNILLNINIGSNWPLKLNSIFIDKQIELKEKKM